MFSKRKGEDRARLEEAYAVATEELTEELGHAPHFLELGLRMASLFRPDERIVESATSKIRELIDDANDFEYMHLGCARYIPFTGLRPHKSQALAFREWYDATFHPGLSESAS